MRPKSNGAIFYRGPSQLDGKPIMAVVTGLKHASANRKTGDLLQVWILADSRQSPSQAVKSGLDASICGDCIHRGTNGKGRTCYVTVVQAPQSVWRTVRRRAYPRVGPKTLGLQIAGRAVRLGAYGDPAAVPVEVWQQLTAHASKTVGYTHQWRTATALQSMCMASVDSPAEYAEARAAGWRTFRVRTESEPLQDREIICPASHERPLTSCERCGLCNGAKDSDRRATIAIVAHGSGASTFVTLASLRKTA